MDNENVEEENIEFSEKHQLLCSNILIFEKVLSYLDQLDKASVRLVCKQWEELSRTKWRSNSTLQISCGFREEDEEENTDSKFTRITIKEIVEHVLHVNYNVPSDPLNISEHPFRKMKICGDFEIEMGVMDDVETSFWNIFSPSLRFLHLNDISAAPGGAGHLHRILCELTPNLKEFVYTQRITAFHEPVLVNEIDHGIQSNLTSITINLNTWDYYGAKKELEKSKTGLIFNNAQHRLEDERNRYFMELEFSNMHEFGRYIRDRIREHEGENGGGEGEEPVEPPPPEPQIQGMFPFDWKLLFKTFPNLKKITHKSSQNMCYQRTYIADLYKTFLLDQINFIGQARKTNPITVSIDTWNGVLFGGDVITKFCELSLPIRSFNGDFERTTEAEFRSFLTSHQHTLKELTIHKSKHGYPDDFRSIKTMWLPSGLTYLEMDLPWGQCLDFLEHVPNLETLIFNNVIKTTDVGMGFSLLFEHKCVKPLTRMKVFFCNIVLEEDAFNKVVSLMPNLAKLTIGMDYKRWMIAGWVWRDLEHLELVQRHWNKTFYLDEDSFVQFAYRFQKLKTFVLQSVSETHFGDLAIYEGFMKMPQLQSLTIKFAPEATENAITALRKKVAHVCILG